MKHQNSSPARSAGGRLSPAYFARGVWAGGGLLTPSSLSGPARLFLAVRRQLPATSSTQREDFSETSEPNRCVLRPLSRVRVARQLRPEAARKLPSTENSEAT